MGETDLRVIKTLEGIGESFLCCLDQVGFQNMTIKNVTERARINRSTFYKHYADKYDLRDQYIDKVIREFVETLDANFIHIKELNMDTYYGDLRRCLEYMRRRERIYLTLWNASLLGRNVFEEMIDGGVRKLVLEFEKEPTIPKEKSDLFTLYARLFLGNMMVSVRWWFVEGRRMEAEQFTRLMILHMTDGIFPTLKNGGINGAHEDITYSGCTSWG